MALTPEQRIKILADKLFSKHLKDIDQEAFGLLITSMSQREFDDLRRGILSNSRPQVGTSIITLVNKEAVRRAEVEATASWDDRSLTEPEFDRAFE